MVSLFEKLLSVTPFYGYGRVTIAHGENCGDVVFRRYVSIPFVWNRRIISEQVVGWKDIEPRECSGLPATNKEEST